MVLARKQKRKQNLKIRSTNLENQSQLSCCGCTIAAEGSCGVWHGLNRLSLLTRLSVLP